jgi:TPP-dependent pyruvate/acetoin dehydrogenase alpha subunit
LARWIQKKSGLLYTFPGCHDALMSLVPVAHTLSTSTYFAATHVGERGPELVNSAAMRIGQHSRDDPQANRRSQELIPRWRQGVEDQP